MLSEAWCCQSQCDPNVHSITGGAEVRLCEIPRRHPFAGESHIVGGEILNHAQAENF